MNINQLKKYCESHNINASTYQKMSELSGKDGLKTLKSKGIAINHEDFNIIAYDDNLPNDEKLIVFAHEIGHHVMKHLTSRKCQNTAAETEADIFATVFMALSVFTESERAAIY